MHKKKRYKVPKKRRIRLTALLASLLLVIGLAISGTLAYITATVDCITNTFQPSQVTTAVVETFENGVKKDVKIQNTGDIDAWIRAYVLVTWQDGNGNVYGELPVKDTDYTITYDLASGWLKGEDGFYYWSTPLAFQEGSNLTGVLLSECKAINGQAPEGYSLAVEIVGSGLQSVPARVFNETWTSSGLIVGSDNTLIKKTGGNS